MFGMESLLQQMPPRKITSSTTEHMSVEASIHSEPVKMQGRDSQQIFQVRVQAVNYFCKRKYINMQMANCCKYDHLHINIKPSPHLKAYLIGSMLLEIFPDSPLSPSKSELWLFLRLSRVLKPDVSKQTARFHLRFLIQPFGGWAEN